MQGHIRIKAKNIFSPCAASDALKCARTLSIFLTRRGLEAVFVTDFMCPSASQGRYSLDRENICLHLEV